jgi:transcriptional antiterminator RfaH
VAFWAVAQAETLFEHVAQRNLERVGFESYLPRIEIRHRIVPLFPSYFFVRIVAVWGVIVATPGVIRLLGADEQPSRVLDAVVDGIRRREVNGVVQLPKQRGLAIGDRVRVANGTFNGQFGLYAGQAPHDRIAVLLELLGRSTRVELPAADVLPLVDGVD